jgi:hypothetical protein
MQAAPMTGPQKLDFIRDQILQVRAGLLSFITCPYCGEENTPVDEKMCCPLFAEAGTAVLDRMEKQQAIDFLRTIQDKVN